MRMQVILDSSFARPGSAPIWGGKKKEFRDWTTDYFDNVMTKFIVNNRTDALKIDVNLFFTITNCEIVRSSSLPRRINYKFMSLFAY